MYKNYTEYFFWTITECILNKCIGIFGGILFNRSVSVRLERIGRNRLRPLLPRPPTFNIPDSSIVTFFTRRSSLLFLHSLLVDDWHVPDTTGWVKSRQIAVISNFARVVRIGKLQILIIVLLLRFWIRTSGNFGIRKTVLSFWHNFSARNWQSDFNPWPEVGSLWFDGRYDFGDSFEAFWRPLLYSLFWWFLKSVSILLNCKQNYYYY